MKNVCLSKTGILQLLEIIDGASVSLSHHIFLTIHAYGHDALWLWTGTHFCYKSGILS